MLERVDKIKSNFGPNCNWFVMDKKVQFESATYTDANGQNITKQYHAPWVNCPFLFFFPALFLPCVALVSVFCVGFPQMPNYTTQTQVNDEDYDSYEPDPFDVNPTRKYAGAGLVLLELVLMFFMLRKIVHLFSSLLCSRKDPKKKVT